MMNRFMAFVKGKMFILIYQNSAYKKRQKFLYTPVVFNIINTISWNPLESNQ